MQRVTLTSILIAVQAVGWNVRKAVRNPDAEADPQTTWRRIKTALAKVTNTWTFERTPIDQMEGFLFHTVHDMLEDMPEFDADGNINEPYHFLHQMYRLLWGGTKRGVDVPPGNDLRVLMQVAFNIGQYNALDNDIVSGIEFAPVDVNKVIAMKDIDTVFVMDNIIYEELNEALNGQLE